MLRHALYAITLLGTQFYLYHLVIHRWLGYPVVPATTTNEYWAIVGLNVEIGLLVLVLLVPTLLVAGAVTLAVATVLTSARLVWALRGEIRD